jgi:hypothetical protein
MNDLLPILIPGLAAALAAILVTLAIERLGGQLGGILGTLPLTVVPASLGLFHADPRADVFATAMSAIPLGMLLNAAFLGVWRMWPIRAGDRSTALMETLGLSLGFWMIAALFLVVVREALSPNTKRDVLVGVVALLTTVVLGVRACRNAPPAPKGNRRVGFRVLLLRGLGAGAAIACGVALGRAGWMTAAGMASVFPAIFLTSMLATWMAQGRAVPIGASGPMMLGSVAVSIYALVCAFSMPWAGALWGSILGWIAGSVFGSLPAYLWLRKRISAV